MNIIEHLALAASAAQVILALVSHNNYKTPLTSLTPTMLPF